MTTFPGSRFLQVQDPHAGTSFRVWLVYPTQAPSEPVTFGPYSLDLSMNAALAAPSGRLPVVLVSHGSGSSPFLFRELATRLARAGYLVALLEHAGNHRNDNSLAEDYDRNLVQRPRHLRLTLDALAEDAQLGSRIELARVAVMGQSLGAYTALAAAGGIPCSRSGQPLTVEQDPRVAALILLTPAVFWFVPEGALRNVSQPILIFACEEDAMTPPWHAQLVYWTVPDRSRVSVHLVPRAGHLSLLSPLPASASWRDPEGFDRAAVHAAMGTQIEAFLASALRI